MEQSELIISASLMCANLLDLRAQLDTLKDHSITHLHYDVMDGEFVPNLTLGLDLFNQIRADYPFSMDVHFLTSHPSKYIARMNINEGDMISIHMESDEDIVRFSDYIHSKGALFGLAISPSTPIVDLRPHLGCIDYVLFMMIPPGFAGVPITDDAFDRLSELQSMLDSSSEDIFIEVDGHVCDSTIPQMIRLGAKYFVAGSSSIFSKDGDLDINIINMKKMLQN